MFNDDGEALDYLTINGCTFDRGVIYPPQDGFEAWNSNKWNWVAVNLLCQEYDHAFERYRP